MCLIIGYFILSINYYYDYELNEVIGGKEKNRLIQTTYSDDLIDYFNNSNFESHYMIYNLTTNIDIHEINIVEKLREDLKIYAGSLNISNGELIISKNISDKLSYNINDNLKLNILDKTYSFKIAGIVENSDNEIFLNEDNLNRIIAENNIEPLYINAIVKNYKNVDTIINDLLKNGYNSYRKDLSDQLHINAVKDIKSITTSVSLLLITILILILYHIIKDIFRNEEKNIAILKTLGYKRRQIIKIIFFRTNILILSSSFFLYLLFFITYNLNKLIKINILSRFINTKLFIINSSYIIIILFIFNLLINILYFQKIKKMNIVELLSE